MPGGHPETVAAWPLRESADTPTTLPGDTSAAAPTPVAAPTPAAPPPAQHRANVARVRLWQRRSVRAGALGGTLAALAAAAAFVVTSRQAAPVPAAVAPAPTAPAPPSADGRIGFRLTTGRVTGTDHALHTVVGMPGETIPLSLDGAAEPALSTTDGRVDRTADGWAWTLPTAPGLARLTVTDGATRQVQRVQALVMTPYDGSGRMDGYQIGPYANDPDPTRPRPTGFVALPPSMEDVPVSTHFRLGDFACKQPGDPRYLMLDERLLVKLETLLVRVRAEGIAARNFVVMSGYRTPHYNAAIGNETSRSAHLYGQAADIYIDDDGDGQMDDITGDGRVTRADAERLAAIASPLDDDPRFVGGLGIYSPAPHRGPFIHVDTRGRRSRW